ncbi:hypothetical protein LOTGIDRAFT_165705 [Lottia gigantea]|uniref:Arrestin-like N-terminal domain-containing protein n=1 Tax=Lottia gigantea TaxID=225164 RepID=V3ZV62_LOTGI|nr:hypothetical protein LOTGIDRAFT_165705 [Lottia gigantea]ESO88267.1 hypothetical protein LOTGIDRAFT_165705 [Lottia gigantea]
MGKLTRFEINIDAPSPVFYAGQIVQGRVTVELSEPKKVRGIRLSFYGRAFVHWSERVHRGSGNNRRTETVHYRAEEEYFNQEVLLSGQCEAVILSYLSFMR